MKSKDRADDDEPMPEWVVGTEPTVVGTASTLYVTHLAAPRYVCRVHLPAATNDILAAAADGHSCEMAFEWFGAEPKEAMVTRASQEIMQVLLTQAKQRDKIVRSAQRRLREAPAASDTCVIRAGEQFDRWIVGEGTDSQTEYLLHLSEPVFICKVGNGAELSAVSYGCADGTNLYDVLWIDDPPDEWSMRELFRTAEMALARYRDKPGAESVE